MILYSFKNLFNRIQMTCQINSIAFWDSTPIGRSIDLCLCPYEQLSPQLILEDKVFRSAIRLQNEFIGTLISDDESQRLTYVIDRHSIPNDTNHHQPLTGEFLVVVQYDNKYSTIKNNLIQNAMKVSEISSPLIKKFLTFCHCRRSICIVVHPNPLNYIDFYIFLLEYLHYILLPSIYHLIS